MSTHGDDDVPAPDCIDVLDAVYSYVDGELAEDDVASIRAHLEDCGPCLRQYDLEQALKALVRRSCQDRAPDHLRTRILAEIMQAKVSEGGLPDGTTVEVTEVTQVTKVTEVRVTTEG
jgi:mycothiol system anti-sigma-R factor